MMYAEPVARGWECPPTKMGVILANAPRFGSGPKEIQIGAARGAANVPWMDLRDPANVAVLSHGRAEAFKALSDLRRYSRFSAGWDGRRSCAPVRRSFDLAEDFISLLLFSGKTFSITAELYADGRAVLNVARDSVAAQFQFFEDGVIASIIGDWDDDVSDFDGKIMPADISDRLGLNE